MRRSPVEARDDTVDGSSPRGLGGPREGLVGEANPPAALKEGRKRAATGAPCAIELVETKAKRPPRGTAWKYWEALMNQPVT